VSARRPIAALAAGLCLALGGSAVASPTEDAGVVAEAFSYHEAYDADGNVVRDDDLVDRAEGLTSAAAAAGGAAASGDTGWAAVAADAAIGTGGEATEFREDVSRVALTDTITLPAPGTVRLVGLVQARWALQASLYAPVSAAARASVELRCPDGSTCGSETWRSSGYAWEDDAGPHTEGTPALYEEVEIAVDLPAGATRLTMRADAYVDTRAYESSPYAAETFAQLELRLVLPPGVSGTSASGAFPIEETPLPPDPVDVSTVEELEDAVRAAAETPVQDVIRVAAGTYELTDELRVPYPLVVSGPSEGRATIVGADADTSIFSVRLRASLALERLHLSGGQRGVDFLGSELSIRRTTISGADEVGIWVQSGGAEIVNSTLSGNALGLSTESNDAVVLRHVTVAANDEGLANWGSVTAWNTAVVENGADCPENPIDDGAGNIDGDGSCGADTGAAQLGPLADNGGPAPTHLPGAASALLDAGVAARCAQIDQRGVARPQGDGCDVGAVERETGAPPPPPPPSGPCVVVEPAETLDFGTAPLSAPGETPVRRRGDADVVVRNCGSEPVELTVAATDAAGGGAAWQLVDVGEPCAAGPNRFALALGDLRVGTDAKPLATLAADATLSRAPWLSMPCAGSAGAGKTLAFQIVVTATG